MKIIAVESFVYRLPGRSFVGALVYPDEGLTGLGEATLMERSGSVRAALTEMGEIVAEWIPWPRKTSGGGFSWVIDGAVGR